MPKGLLAILILRAWFVALIVMDLPMIGESAVNDADISNFVDASSSNSNKKIFMESSRTARRKDVTKMGRAPLEKQHALVFAVRPRNMESLEALLLKISDPHDAEYGQHMEREEMQKMTANTEARDALRAHLQSIPGVVIRAETLYGEYITATAPVRVWENMLDTTFHTYRHDVKIPTTRTTTDVSSSLRGGESSASGAPASSSRELLRCERYSLPAELHAHVAHVFGTVQMPLSDRSQRPYGTSDRVERFAWDQTQPLEDAARQWKRAPAAVDPAESADQNHRSLAGYNGYTPTSKNCFMNNTMTPCRVRQVYQITGVGSTLATQGVFASRNESFSPSDLRTFQMAFNLIRSPVSAVVGGHANGDKVCAGMVDCGDVMLDAEYLMSTAPRSPTTFWYVNESSHGATGATGPWTTSAGVDVFTAWLLQLNSPRTIPFVLTVHFSGPEGDVAGSYKTAFSTEMVRLGAIGVTVVVAAGDDGAPGPYAHNGDCGYEPQFPASNPYVLAVGATQGLEQSYKMEKACQSDTGGYITTGGGFSKYYTAPSYQQSAVSGYLRTMTTPATGYLATGRGYPDISAAGVNYVTVVGGEVLFMSGTSASTSVIAGMVTLVNARRLAAGYSTVGWLNPTLYTLNATIGVNDVIGGHNKCITKAPGQALVCCSEGFYGARGWDPVTGFGSLNFTQFSNEMMALVRGTTYRPTYAPSGSPVAPSLAPSAKPIRKPTFFPSMIPTRPPTLRPTTFRPTFKPTQVPTRPPTRRPTIAPSSSRPTGQPSRQPTKQPFGRPTGRPSLRPTMRPSSQPTRQPTNQPTRQPSTQPTMKPTRQPSAQPSRQPFSRPTGQPSRQPSAQPSR